MDLHVDATVAQKGKGGGVFTMYPMMEKNLDDVLHTKPLTYGRSEMVINIDNVSHFTKKKCHVDKDTQYQASKVYLVNHTVTIFPHLMYNISFRLNENTEILVLSCIWIVNMGGTVEKYDD